MDLERQEQWQGVSFVSLEGRHEQLGKGNRRFKEETTRILPRQGGPREDNKGFARR